MNHIRLYLMKEIPDSVAPFADPQAFYPVLQCECYFRQSPGPRLCRYMRQESRCGVSSTAFDRLAYSLSTDPGRNFAYRSIGIAGAGAGIARNYVNVMAALHKIRDPIRSYWAASVSNETDSHQNFVD